MCGINLLVDRASPEADTSWVRRANTLLRHRGPDGDAVFARGQFALGHTRLSLMDLIGGAQPLFNEDRSVALVCNGEIYNFAALRAYLVARGHRFRTRSDCEVIVHLYEEHPSTFPSMLRGMFAFALVDWNKGQAHLVRDQFGIKPLFYCAGPKAFVASSECKALLCAPGVHRALDPHAVRTVLTFGYLINGGSVFADIRELPPASWLRVRQDTEDLTIERYWAPTFERRDEPSPEQFAALLCQAVSDHSVADSEVGIYLSGGLDSSCIAAAHARAGAQGRAFSMTFDDLAVDESQYSKAVADHIKLPHSLTHVANMQLRELVSAIYHLEQPQIVTLDVASLRLSRSVRDVGVKAVLAGDGADELFGGYNHFQIDALRRHGDLDGAKLEAALAICGFPRDYLEMYRSGIADAPQLRERLGLYPPWYPTWFAKQGMLHALMREGTRDLLGDHGPLQAACRTMPKGFASLTEFDRSIGFELATRLPGWILLRTDRDSMANSVEVRVPFLDERVVGYVCGLPERARLLAGNEKPFLRDAFANALPARIVARRKQAFNVSSDWLFEGHELVADLLSPTRLRESGIFNERAVAALVSAVVEGGDRGGMGHAVKQQTLVAVLTTQITHALFVSSGGRDTIEADLGVSQHRES